jgi:prevent-host-death family protein
MVMTKVNVFEVKARLSEYLDRAATGERILICRHNEPVAELRAVAESRREARPIGPLPGRLTFAVPPVFFEPLSDEELDLWDGGPPARGRSRARLAGGASKVAESTAAYRVGRKRPRRRTRP